MNKNNYKDNYIAVLKAVKLASSYYDDKSDNVRLYLNEESGLANIPLPEIRDILTSLQDEEFIKIIKYPRISVLLHDRNLIPKDKREYLPGMLQTLLLGEPIQNYYTIQLCNKARFSYVYYNYLIPLSLNSVIPSGEQYKKKYKVLRKIVDLLINANEHGVKCYDVAASFIPVVGTHTETKKKRKLLEYEYDRNKDYYNGLIENRLKTLRKKLEEYGYTVKRENDVLKITEI